jgi:alkanesulfonate monooxygenase SsuD/methylene tetrahydromethanopterin reductase-like flavin-dependent oxidoreductase (luciferase family)
MPLRVLEERMSVYRRALAEWGRAGHVKEFPIRRDVYVASNRETARLHVEPYLSSYRGFTAEAKTGLFIGSPEDLISDIERYHRAAGCDHFLFRHIVPEQERRLDSIRLIGEKVIPHFGG